VKEEASKLSDERMQDAGSWKLEAGIWKLETG